MDEAAFETAHGDSVPAVTASEMREVDRVAVDDFGIGVLQMMEHAGRALAAVGRERSEEPVTVLAGDGGNGGGGLCAARHLRNHGAEVRVVLDREHSAHSGPAAHHHATLREMGVSVGVGADAVPADTALFLDALVGYGLSGPLCGTAGDLAEKATDHAASIVSLDVPSGRDATTGEQPGPGVEPDSVVTLALPKTGLRDLDAGLRLADIGLPASVYERLDIPPFVFKEYVVELSTDD